MGFTTGQLHPVGSQKPQGSVPSQGCGAETVPGRGAAFWGRVPSPALDPPNQRRLWGEGMGAARERVWGRQGEGMGAAGRMLQATGEHLL